MERTLNAKATLRLNNLAPLPLDPRRSIAIKRDVHQFEVSCDAAAFADAFRAEVTAPENMFGLIRVKRPVARMGQDFVVGERFQGCFSLERAVLNALERRDLKRVRKFAKAFFELAPVSWLVGRLENLMLSNYAEIETIAMNPDVSRGEIHHMRYRYLAGTPIAGSSLFTIENLRPGRCLVRQTFEFQEVNGIALATFQRFGLKLHDQVVHMQICKSAERAGATVLSGTIPLAYARA